LDISQLHVFTYSERPGTQALKIGHTVAPADKKARSARLLRLSDEKWQAFYSLRSGKEAKALFEHTKIDGRMHGFTENYIRVEMPYDAALVNCAVRVKLGAFNLEKTALKAERCL